MGATPDGENFDRLDLTPDPRVLQMLGRIPYPPWRCFAELIDNSFDDLLMDPARGPADPGAVHIIVPNTTATRQDAVVRVLDRGRGMTRESLERSLRAGYTGKAQFGTLGLFGMGFNIATARFGNRTEVRTTRAGDAHWVVTEIDLREMQRRHSFHVPFRHEPKVDPSLHGTEITVSDLDPEMLTALKRSTTITAVKRQLGHIYSYLLRGPNPVPGVPDTPLAGRGIALYLNGKRIEPWIPCVWSASRIVTRRGAEISAVQLVDRHLSDAYACMQCGNWQSHNDTDGCEECNSLELQLRPRRIHGWLGVQRYLDNAEYGIDFLRHGRKIVTDDKELFTWTDPDTDEKYPEYPIDIPANQGRLVGEIHLDHVPVDYQKKDFERSFPDWNTAVRTLRGETPMREKKAKALKLGDNDSPLGKLFKAFQENRPGLKCLIPGDGTHATHELARRWGESFHQGLSVYQTDEMWYEAAARHDETVARGRATGSGDTSTGGAGGDLEGRTGLDPLPPDDPAPDPKPDPKPASNPYGRRPDAETEEERFTRYRKDARELYDMAGTVNIAGIGRRDVRVFETTATLAKEGVAVPVTSRAGTGMSLEVIVNGNHPIFREFGRDTRDYAVIEIAQLLRALAGRDSTTPITALAAEVTAQFPDQRTTPSALRDRAEAVLGRIHDLTAPLAASRSEEFWDALPNSSKVAAERDAARAEPSLDWPTATLDGGFAAYLGSEAIATLVSTDPGAFLDGAVFTFTWAGWTDPQARNRQVSQVVRLLETVGEFIADQGPKTRQDLAMTRLSIDMLDQAVTRSE
jgi:hypothetical protein